MREWLDALLAVVLAPLCVSCGRPLPAPTRGGICGDCREHIERFRPPLCDRCGDPLEAQVRADLICADCLRAPSIIERSRAVGRHDGALRTIIHALKYDGRRSVAAPLASLMCAAGAELIEASAAVVPVPLHPARRRERGFNQAEDLACHLGLPVVRALRRVVQTATQTALPAQDRRANVAGAFRATRHARRLAGASVLLVDDVRTTGSTLEACAIALRGAGVPRVNALTASRVETPRS